MAHVLDPDDQLPLALAGSVAQRLKPWLPEAMLARCVEAQGDAIAGALLLVQQTPLCP